MARDYTEVQKVVDTLQQALDDRLGEGALQPGDPPLRARSVDDVAHVVEAASGYGGHVTLGEPGAGLLALDLSGLTTVRNLDATSGLVTVEAGATPEEIGQALAEEGLGLGPAHFARPDASIGAAIAGGEGAPLTVSLGVVLPDGTLFETPVAPRRATGPDPVWLQIGTEGRFGIIVWVTLRARPLLRRPVDVALRGSASKLLEALRAVLRTGLDPFALQLRKGSRGKATVTARLGDVSAGDELRAALEAAGGEPCEPDGELPPSGRPVRLGWRALAGHARGQGKRGLFVSSMDLHGGWARVPGAKRGTDPRLERLRAAADPQGTLRLAGRS